MRMAANHLENDDVIFPLIITRHTLVEPPPPYEYDVIFARAHRAYRMHVKRRC